MIKKTSFITLQDAATLIGVHPNTLRKWIKSNRIDAYAIGKNYMFDSEEITKFSSEHPELKEDSWYANARS